MILLLAGTAEARALAQALADRNIPAITTLSGATREPRPLPLPTLRGGFGGAEPFRDFLNGHAIRAVIDATHPFADTITTRTARICAEERIPYLRLQRPDWTPNPGERWHVLPDYAALATLIPDGARILATTGRGSAKALAPLAATRTIFLRVIDDGPLPDGLHPLVARPPFDLAAETETLRRNRIDWLLVKNAGGAGGRAKLDAAAALGLPVAVLNRPPLPEGIAVVQTVPQALDWLAEQARHTPEASGGDILEKKKER